MLNVTKRKTFDSVEDTRTFGGLRRVSYEFHVVGVATQEEEIASWSPRLPDFGSLKSDIYEID